MKNRIFLKLYLAALLIIVACTLTMAVLLRHAWVGMLRGEIETSLRQKTLMFASRVGKLLRRRSGKSPARPPTPPMRG